jgi:hypothetical protein
MRLADSEILELNGIGFGDESLTLKILLFFDHVPSMFLKGFFLVLLLELSQFPKVENLVPILVVLLKALFVFLIHFV